MDVMERIEMPPADAPLDTLPAPHWRVIGASVQGTSHAKTGQPCQDAFAWERTADGTLIVAVADGAGSALFGEIGAEIAVQSALQTVRAGLAESSWLDHMQQETDEQQELSEVLEQQGEDTGWHDLLRNALQSAREAVETEAWARQISERDLASTLILAVMTPDLAAAAQIGDGAAVAMDDDGKLAALTTPANGEFVNQTTFLVSPDALDSEQFAVWRGRAANLAVFTDGLQMLALKMPEGAPHAPFFAPMFRFAAGAEEPEKAGAELAAFLRSPRVAQRTDDDLTLVLAAREG